MSKLKDDLIKNIPIMVDPCPMDGPKVSKKATIGAVAIGVTLLILGKVLGKKK